MCMAFLNKIMKSFCLFVTFSIKIAPMYLRHNFYAEGDAFASNAPPDYKPAWALSAFAMQASMHGFSNTGYY